MTRIVTCLPPGPRLVARWWQSVTSGKRLVTVSVWVTVTVLGGVTTVVTSVVVPVWTALAKPSLEASAAAAKPLIASMSVITIVGKARRSRMNRVPPSF